MHGEGGPPRSYLLAVHRTRVGIYALAIVVSLVVRWLGVHAELMAVLAGGIGFALLAAFYWLLEARGVGERVPLLPFWIVTDAISLGVAVGVSGGFDSPWYLWMMATTMAATFVGGRRAFFGCVVANTIVYVGVIAYLHQLGDGRIGIVITRMLVLYLAMFFAAQGIEDLQRKRVLVRRLKEDESRKVAELTRLTQALDERTHALAEANARIRESDRLKSQFLANMSHELRTPLNSVIGFSEILMQRIGPTIDAKFARFLGSINNSGKHLLGLINDLLDLSKIEAGKMELLHETLKIPTVVDGVIAVMRGVALERKIDFEVALAPELPAIQADPVRLKQILYNLLSNAVKFSAEGAVVRVEARAIDKAESPIGRSAIELAVIDRGIGIDPAHHDLVFQEFRQVDGSAGRAHEGTGLGLALVKRFVELHKGRITLESALGQGSTFRVVLPCSFSGTGTSSALRLPVLWNDGRPVVLVVEDDPTVYDRIERDLRPAALHTVRARTGEEALELARMIKPSAITLDLILPNMDGWEVLRRLKADPVTRDIPVVVVSMLENRELGMALGAEGYFVKPPDRDELVKRLSELLPTRGRPRRLLVIDDDPAVGEMLSSMLSPHGFLVDAVTTGSAGLQSAEARRPDVIILDLVMAEMDGFEVAGRLRNDPATASIPILVLTNKDVTHHDRHRLHGQVGALMQKHQASPAGLLGTLEQVLHRRPGANSNG